MSEPQEEQIQIGKLPSPKDCLDPLKSSYIYPKIERKSAPVYTGAKDPRRHMIQESDNEYDSESSQDSPSFLYEEIADPALIKVASVGKKNRMPRIARKTAPITEDPISFADSLARLWFEATRFGNDGLAKDVISILLKNNISHSTNPTRVFEFLETIEDETDNEKELTEAIINFFRGMGYVYYHPYV